MKKTLVYLICFSSLPLQSSDQFHYKSPTEFFASWLLSLQNAQPNTPSEAESFTSAFDQNDTALPSSFSADSDATPASSLPEESDTDDTDAYLSCEDNIALKFHKKHDSKKTGSSQSHKQKKESNRRTVERFFKYTCHQKAA